MEEPEEQSPEIQQPVATQMEEPEKEPLVKQMEEPTAKTKKPMATVLLVIFTIILGIGTGYLLSNKSGPGELRKTQTSLPGDKEKIKKGESFGIDNPDIYGDKAEGVLKINDKSFTDEGSHVLIRDEDNPSQNAYLTSTVVNLDLFIDRKVEVWGETFAAQKAGWLMDVGKVKVLE